MNKLMCPDGSGKWTEYVFVDGSCADRWLLKVHPDQRRTNAGRVRGYERDLRKSVWRVTHQGIAFDNEGYLVDGNTRLTAIAACRIGVWMLVTHGLSPAEVAELDQTRKRNIRDRLRMMGYKGVTTRMVGIARRMVFGSSSAHKATNTPEAMASFVLQHLEAVTDVSALCSPNVPGVTLAPVMAVLARARPYIDRDRLERAISLLRTGDVPDDKPIPGDKSITKLRTWLLTHIKQSGSGTARNEIFARTAYAFTAFVDRHDIKQLRMASSDPFPLPDDGEAE